MKKNSFGFTLIELLISIMIGMLVVGFGSITLNDFYEKQKVESTNHELLSDLRLARNYAVTNQLPTDSPVGTDRVVVAISSDGLVTIKTQKGDSGTNGYTFFSSDITPKNVSITMDDKIEFTVTNGRLIGTTAVNISVKGVGLTKNIKIDESGLIYEK